MTNVPTSHKIARFIVILILLGVFALLTALHLSRFGGRMYIVQEGHAWDVSDVHLPGFRVEPFDNQTRFLSFECASGDSTDIRPYSIRDYAVPYERQSLAKDWAKYQELKAKNPNASVDELLMQLAGQEQEPLSEYALRLLLKNDTKAYEFMAEQRWNTFMIDSAHSNLSDSQPDPVGRKGITCRIGGFQEISAENATVTTPTVVREISSNGTAVPMGVVDPYIYSLPSIRNIPFVMNQQLVLTYAPVRECWEPYVCPFCSRRENCHMEYELSSKDMLPVTNSALLPAPFRNASSPATMANYAYVTIQLNSPSYYARPEVLQRKHVYIYGYLDLVTGVFAAICFLLLVYTLLMGDLKANPFGWVQRFVLFSSRKAYVEQLKAEGAKEEQPLEKVLFSLYLNDSQLEYRKRPPSGEGHV